MQNNLFETNNDADNKGSIYLASENEPVRYSTSRIGYSTFKNKTKPVQKLINEALYVLDVLGIPVETYSVRRLERIALSFLAVLDINQSSLWGKSKSLSDGYALKTREIIDYLNENFGENISSGSYDDIRRKDLKPLYLANIAIPDNPESARNNPNRAWGINPEFIEIIQSFGDQEWESEVEKFFVNREKLRDKLSSDRRMPTIPVILPSGLSLEFGPGEHNEIQKAVIEEFLPRYGYGAEVLYVGDASDKFLHYNEKRSKELGLDKLAHAELPDVVAYSESKKWLYLIEAVHSANPIDEERIIVLENFIKNYDTGIIFITAFLDRESFRKFVADIAWETEVWIVSEPDHLIHFNGDKFLGPYK